MSEEKIQTESWFVFLCKSVAKPFISVTSKLCHSDRAIKVTGIVAGIAIIFIALWVGVYLHYNVLTHMPPEAKYSYERVRSWATVPSGLSFAGLAIGGVVLLISSAFKEG